MGLENIVQMATLYNIKILYKFSVIISHCENHVHFRTTMVLEDEHAQYP